MTEGAHRPAVTLSPDADRSWQRCVSAG